MATISNTEASQLDSLDEEGEDNEAMLLEVSVLPGRDYSDGNRRGALRLGLGFRENRRERELEEGERKQQATGGSREALSSQQPC